MTDTEYLNLLVTFATLSNLFCNERNTLSKITMSLIVDHTSLVVSFDKEDNKFKVTSNKKGPASMDIEKEINAAYQKQLN